MPVSTGATTYKFKGKAKKGESPLTLAKKILNIQEDVFAAQNDGISINDPMQLDYLITKASELYGLAKDESDKLDIEGKVAKWEAQKSQLERKQDVTLIGDALEKDTRDIRYQYFSRNVGSPLQYLSDFTSSYSVLQLVGQGMVDQLTEQRRFAEADSLQKIINKGNELVNTYNDLHSAETVDDLKNFAVTYQTDLQGRVKDMKVLPIDQVKTGYVSLVDGNTGKSLLMDGMQVYVNQQEFDGKKLWKLGGKGGDVAPIDAGLADMFGGLQEKKITGAEAMTMMLAQQKGVAVGLWKETHNLDDPTFRNSIVTSDPIVNTLPGEYFRFADGRVFRNNREGKLDEISPDALKYFSDYNESTTETRLSSLDSNKIQGRTGKYLTEQDLFPMTPASGQPIFKEQPNMTPAPSSTPEAPFTGQPTMTPVGPRISRPTGTQRYSGQEQFNIKTEKLFSGQSSP